MHLLSIKLRKLFVTIVLIAAVGPITAQVVVRNDTTSCDGTSELRAIPSGGIWTTTGGSTIISPSLQTTSVINLDPGANEFRYTRGADIGTVIITNNMLTANAGNDPAASCLTTANLSGNSIPSGGTGLWQLKYPAPGTTITSPGSNTTSVNNLPFGSTIFTWTVSANGCTAIDEINILCNYPENNDATNQTVCNNTFYIDAEPVPSGGSGLWTQVTSPGTVVFSNPSIPGIEITAPRGQSTVRWTITYNTCTSYKDFVIQNNLPNPQAGADQQICSSTANLSATPLQSGETGLWSIIGPQGEIISNPSISNPTVSNLKIGTTSFLWTIDNGLCISTDTMQVVNNLPSINAGKDTSICTSTYSLLANNHGSETGTWSCSNTNVVIHSPNSYNSAVSNLENGTYTFNWSISNSKCTANDQVIVQSNFVPISAGTSSEGCSGTLNLNGTAIPSGGSGYWSVLSGSGTIDNSLSNVTVASNIPLGIKLRWTIVSGLCTYSNEIDYYNHLPTQALTVSDIIACDNFTTITANTPSALNGETGVWTIESVPGSISIQNPTSFQTQVSNLAIGLNTFRWTISNSYCNTFDLINVSNNHISTNAGTDQNICTLTANLEAQNEGGTGYWTTNSGTAVITSSTDPNSSVSNLVFGSHTFTWTRIDNGCTASDDVIITNNRPTAVNAGADQIVCTSTASLNGNNPLFGTGLWSQTEGTGNIVSASNYQTNLNSLGNVLNTFRWTVTYNGCSNYDDVNITNNSILAQAGIDQSVCNTDESVLAANITGTGQTGLWTVDGGSGVFSNASSATSSVSNLSKGLNTFRWTLSNANCSHSDQLIITNNTPDSAKVATDKIICANTTNINAIAVSNGTGSWSVNQGNGIISNSANNNTTVSNIDPGINIFTWTVTKNGCSLSANQQISNNTVTAVIPVDILHVCRSVNDTIITATEPLGGTWGTWSKVSLGQGDIESPSTFSTRVYNLANGEIRFRWTVQNANCSANDEIVVINDFYSANAWPVGSPDICTNSTSIVGNSGPALSTTKWTSNNPLITFANSTNINTTVQNLPSGQSTLTWTITMSGCPSSANLLLNNYSITTNAGPDIVGCVGDANLSAQPLETGQSGLWTANNVNVIFSNTLSPTSSVSNAPIGNSILTWTINANGCTASDFMILTNNNFVISAGSDRTICATSTSISGSDPLGATGLWTVQSGNSNLSTPSLPTTNVTNIENGPNTYRWTVTRNGCTQSDDVIITNDRYVASVLPAADVCTDTVRVEAVAVPVGSGATGVWTTLSGGGVFDNSLAAQSIVRNMAQGNNQFRWTVTKGSCTTFANLLVNNNDLNVTVGPDQIVCEDYTSIFATPLSATATGLWTGSPGPIIASPSLSGTNITNLQRGQNLFTWTVIDKGCTSSDEIIITLNSFDAGAGIDQNIELSSTTLSASLPDVGATGYWTLLTGNATFSNSTSPTSGVSNMVMGANQFRWTVSWNGCSSYDDVIVIYNVAESNAGLDQSLCATSTTLDAQPPIFGTGRWSVIQGSGTFQNSSQNNTQVTNLAKGTNIFRWTVTAFEIQAYDDVSIINNQFNINAGPDQNTCNNYVNLNGEAPGSGGFGYWYILQGSGNFDDNSIPNPQVTNIFAGTSKYVWEVQRNGCSTTDTVAVLRYQPPTTANAGTDAVVCNSSNTYLLGNIPSVGTGKWTSENILNTFDNVSSNNARVSNLSYGPNNLWWTINTQYCSSIDMVVISVFETLAITSQPVSQNFIENGTLSLTIETSGGVKNYQWQKNGQNLVDGSRINGATSKTLTISSLEFTDAGSYTCVLQGYCNNLSSNAALVDIVSGIEEVENNQFKVFPNPSNGIFNLEFENSAKASNLLIVNLGGQKVVNKPIVNHKESIDLSQFNDGIYMLYLTINKKLVKTKIVLQK
jgi:hypothetical protein